MKTEEQFSEEEKAVLTAMENDNEPIKEPASEPAPEPEPKAEDPEPDAKPEFKSSRAEDEKKPPEGFVPHQAMHAERMKRQELERKLAEIEARLPKPEEEKPPQYVDPLEDPEGFRKYDEWRDQENKKRWEELQNQQRSQYEYEQRRAQVKSFETEFAAKNPDYEEAAKFLHGKMVSEMASQGYAEDQIKAQLSQGATALVNAAIAAGVNPAQLVYLRAQEAGYQKRATPPQDETQKLEAQATAQRQTQGLGSSTGAQGGKLTADQLANMSEKEFNKVPEEEIQRLFGG